MNENNEIKYNSEGSDGLDTQNSKDVKAGGEDTEKLVQEEKAADDRKEEDLASSKATAAKDPEGDKRSADGEVNTSPKYSASYNPPYYSPTVSSNAARAEATAVSKAKTNRINSGLIVALCVVSLLLALALLVLGASIISNGLINDGNIGGDNRIDILKGNKVINIVDDGDRESYTIPEVVDMVASSVVEITTKHAAYNPFFGEYVTGGAGSGVIFDQDGKTGYIVTNYHVIDGADEITVIARVGGEQKTYLATYVAGDDAEDIAVLTVKVEESDKLSCAVFRDIENSPLKVGEDVVAIGNPLGQLGGTVTNGIVSALDREITVDSNKMTLLQTNAAVNPGNSGGGLFDSSGLLIGIVNAKQSETGIEGLGFAIPADKVLSLITDIIEKGYVTGRATLGIGVEYGTLSNGVKGVIVTSPTGAFEKYDCITEINGEAIDTLADYNAVLDELSVGQTVNIRVRRGRNYENIEITVLEDTSR